MKAKLLGWMALAFLSMPIPALAVPMTLYFSASDFGNGGNEYPGFAGPISGTLSWDANSPADPISAFTSIDLIIGGHQYSLAEIGIAGQGTTQTGLGGLANGAGQVIGDGMYDDFLFVFDRIQPAFVSFAYSIEGKTSAIWWFPAVSEAHYVYALPEPASIALLSVALLAMGAANRRRQGKRHAA